MRKEVLGLLVFLGIILVMGASGCGSQPAAAPQPVQASQPTALSYVIKDCSALGTEDVKAVFNTDVTQDKGTVDPGTCAKQWTAWQATANGQTPIARPYLAITNTTTRPGSPTPSQAISRTCANKPSLGLGDGVSCNIVGDVFFTKKDYLVEMACVNCPDDYGMKLANLVNGRI